MDGRGRYVRLRTQEPDDAWTADQFKAPPPKVPVQAIQFAAVLLVAGTLLILAGSMLLAGYFSADLHDRGIPFVVLGSLLVIPGAYHVVIAWCAYFGYKGYSFNDIPRFNDH